MAEAIKIEGLAEFSRNLKKLDSDLPKVLRLALKESADLVANEVRPKVPTRRGRARASVKARATRTEARVLAGGDRAPYYKWLDWGGSTGRGHMRGKPGSGAIKRPFIKGEGRYLFATYTDLKTSGRFQEVLTKALLEVAAQAGVVID